jgi:hypothetical protein
MEYVVETKPSVSAQYQRRQESPAVDLYPYGGLAV